jgi:hypothetical protein
MWEVIKKEVLTLLHAGIIYPIPYSEWVSPVQVVPNKGGMTVVENSKNELVLQRTVMGWRMCIDYIKLNSDEEGSLTATLHQWDAGKVSETLILLFPWWLFWLPLDSYPSRQPKQDHLHVPPMEPMPIKGCHLGCVMHPHHSKGVWCPSSRVWLRKSWKSWWMTSRFMVRPSIIAWKLGQGLATMLGKGLGAKLGKVPLHGRRRHHSWTFSVWNRDRGG